MKASCRKLGHLFSSSTMTLVKLEGRGRLKLVHVALVVALAGCGGIVIESSSDSGGGGHGGSSGAGGNGGTGGSGGVSAGSGGGSGGANNLGDSGSPPAKDSGSPYGDGNLRPEVGSNECVVQNGTCVLCSDDNWHCGTAVYPQCPATIGPNGGGSCVPGKGFPCVTCDSDGIGYEVPCSDLSASIVSCSPLPGAIMHIP
jgi:hypothetical protein